MNCAECRDNLVACAEGLLDREQSLQCQAHLETCPGCRAEYQGIVSLQKQLATRGQTAAGVSIVAPVMRRVLQEQTKPERETIMSTILKHRWGFGLGATATAAAAILIALLSTPKMQAAAEVMTKGAQAVAKLTTIHLRGQMRTRPAENFAHIDPECDFVTMELWKQLEPELKWRVEKPGRVAVMDGQSTLQFIKPDEAMKFPHPSSDAFDTDWLHKIANLSNTITNELNNAIAKGWKLSLTEEQAADGRIKSVVTVEAKSGLPESDYLKNKFFDDSDTRRVYRFDAQTELLETVQVYLVRASGEVLIFEVNQIDCNQPVDPDMFRLELPANVIWEQELQKLPDNEKYAAMTAEQAARAFFEACAREDWDEAGKFMSPITPGLKQYLGGLEILSLGEAFTSRAYDPTGRFVPYQIKLKNDGVKKHNLALKKDEKTGRWFVDGGL